MQWKPVLIQAFATFVAVLLGLRLFDNCGNNAALLETMHKTFSSEIELVKNHLASIERTTSGHQQESSGVLNQPSRETKNKEVVQSLQAISDRLARLEARLGIGDHQKQSVPPFAPGGGTPPPQRLPMSGNPLGWMQGLTEQKRRQVDEVFKQQGSLLRERLPPPAQGEHLDPQALKEIIEENDRELREKLRMVLNEEEYQKFSDSLPKPPDIASPGQSGPN
jgi:hypothetical protein